MTVLQYNRRIIQLTDTKNIHKLNTHQKQTYFSLLRKYVKDTNHLN